MSGLTSSTLASLRASFADTLLDTCVHQTRTETRNSLGEMVPGDWADQQTYRCGLNLNPSPRASREIRGADGTVTESDAEIRLPLAALGVIGIKDRLKITHRTGEALAAPLYFDVEGEVRPGPLGCVASLRRATR